MILTEKEAGKRICCGPPMNFHEFHDSPFCIASRCMAWRWKDETCNANGEGWKGYCGLARMPEPMAKEEK